MKTFYEFKDEITKAFHGQEQLDYKEAYNVYKRILNEYNFNERTEETIIHNIAWDMSRNGRNLSADRAFEASTTANHLEYFDNFLSKGETDAVLKALYDNKISTNVLKGLRPSHDYSATFTTEDGRSGAIQQKVEKPDGDSPLISSLYIEVDGKIIYSFDKNNEIEDEEIVSINDKINFVSSFVTGRKKGLVSELEIGKEKYYIYTNKNKSVMLAKKQQGSNLIKWIKRDSIEYEEIIVDYIQLF